MFNQINWILKKIKSNNIIIKNLIKIINKLFKKTKKKKKKGKIKNYKVLSKCKSKLSNN